MVYASFDIESQFWKEGKSLICGIDEVGRGCFAGPVVVGAVIFPKKSSLISGIADSKLLKPKQREELSVLIKQQAESWVVVEVDVLTINEIGIGKATQMAFRKAVKALDLIPDHILIDAFYIEELSRENQSAVKNGDTLSATIAAASIIAKVYRDALMEGLDSQYPEYGFAKHKGYGTKEHQEALKKHGLSKIHRTSFDLSRFL
jgi:ribonuclease HII